MQKSNLEDIIPKVVIGLYIVLAIFGVINSFYLAGKTKVYTVGIIYDKTKPGKGGSTYFFKYIISKREFKGRTSGLNRFTTNKNGYLFLELLKEDHEHYHVLEFNRVPDCFTIENIPEKGWIELPKGLCK